MVSRSLDAISGPGRVTTTPVGAFGMRYDLFAPDAGQARCVATISQHGRVTDAVLTRKMAFLCASCHTCEVRCPRGIEIPKLVEALRQLTLRQGDNYVEPGAVDKGRVRELPQAALVAGFRKFTG